MHIFNLYAVLRNNPGQAGSNNSDHTNSSLASQFARDINEAWINLPLPSTIQYRMVSHRLVDSNLPTIVNPVNLSLPECVQRNT